jgi:hypothetical protein
MSILSAQEITHLRKALRRAILESVAQTLGETLIPKMERVEGREKLAIQSELRNLKALMDRTEMDPELQLSLGMDGIKIADHGTTFHL